MKLSNLTIPGRYTIEITAKFLQLDNQLNEVYISPLSLGRRLSLNEVSTLMMSVG
jgi:hypothetical protein